MWLIGWLLLKKGSNVNYISLHNEMEYVIWSSTNNTSTLRIKGKHKTIKDVLFGLWFIKLNIHDLEYIYIF